MAHLPESKVKSRTFRRVKVRTVKGTKTTFKRKKPNYAQCAVTGERLHGVPRLNATEMKNISKSSRRPSRPFGGVLSSKASKAELKKRARNLSL